MITLALPTIKQINGNLKSQVQTHKRSRQASNPSPLTTDTMPSPTTTQPTSSQWPWQGEGLPAFSAIPLSSPVPHLQTYGSRLVPLVISPVSIPAGVPDIRIFSRIRGSSRGPGALWPGVGGLLPLPSPVYALGTGICGNCKRVDSWSRGLVFRLVSWRRTLRRRETCVAFVR